MSYIFKRFAKGIAKAMKNSYSSVKKSNPGISKKELYIKSLMLRPGYYDRTYAESFLCGDENFREFVLKIVEGEFQKASNLDPTSYMLENRSEHYDEVFMTSIKKIIPDDY